MDVQRDLVFPIFWMGKLNEPSIFSASTYFPRSTVDLERWFINNPSLAEGGYEQYLIHNLSLLFDVGKVVITTKFSFRKSRMMALPVPIREMWEFPGHWNFDKLSFSISGLFFIVQSKNGSVLSFCCCLTEFSTPAGWCFQLLVNTRNQLWPSQVTTLLSCSTLSHTNSFSASFFYGWFVNNSQMMTRLVWRLGMERSSYRRIV